MTNKKLHVPPLPEALEGLDAVFGKGQWPRLDSAGVQLAKAVVGPEELRTSDRRATRHGARVTALSIADVMARLGVSRKTVIALRAELGGYRVGRQWRFDPADVDAFVKTQKAAARPAPRPRLSRTPPPATRSSAGVTWKGSERYT